MARRSHLSPADEARETALAQAMEGFVDPAWYTAKYPDVGSATVDPIRHFIRHGLGEQRDPNRFFDGGWYAERYPDVGGASAHPLLHYLQFGAAQLRNPHPNFDAAWYVEQHPDAVANPLLYHLQIGEALGYPTERPIEILDYLPSRRSAPSLKRTLIVDVIIPVYRGLDETRRCIDSVLADQARPLGRIIIIEDRCPEPELVAWLSNLTRYERIRLIRNRRNLGFVASVNRGMREAGDRDVVLLNSDTEVPKGWLRRLAAQAYATPRIASVSPLSNHATICGYPDNEGGKVAFGRSTQDIDDVCRTVNAGRWVDAPTTVGFCMYLRRAAIDAAGYFDARRFTAGYGEENDFCLRASALGWRHRIACDLFVYHKGSVSFGDRTEGLIARATSLILERYPTYARDVAVHVSLGAIDPFRFAITAALLAQSGLPVILLITHGLGGGVGHHIEAIIARHRGAAHFLLLEATARGTTLSVPELAKHPKFVQPAGRMDELLMLLGSMNVSRIHIHHLLGIDIDVRALIRRLGVPFDVTVHDYYAICPQINLLQWPYSLYCGEPGPAACNACIAQRTGYDARDIVTWRAERAWQFEQAGRVFCPSQDVIDRLQRYRLAANAVLAPHEPVVAGPWPLRVHPVTDGPMRIAIIGTLVNHKGARTVAAVAETADPKAIEIHLIGDIDGRFPERARNRMRITGRYREADLTDLIETIAPHLVWLPAAWPETFSFTLSAAINAGLPIATTRIGAHRERLAGRPFSWLVDPATTPAQWIGLFGDIRERLKDRPEGPMPQRPAVGDVYAQHYLAAPAVRRRAARSRPRIAIVPERFDAGFPTPCGYIRLIQPLFHPSITRDFDVSIQTASTIFETAADIIVSQRYAVADTDTADRLKAHAKRCGARLVYDLDDDLLAIPRNHADAKQLRPKGKIVRRMLDLADAVHLSTHGLAERMAALRPDAVVIENRLDEQIWTRPMPPPAGGPVRILLMGTVTHKHDYALIEPALLRLKADYDEQVTIDVVGMSDQGELPEGLERLYPASSAWRSYPSFVHWMASMQPGWHLGLAPLLDTSFNRCKSAIKAMDYAALGLGILASDVAVFRGSIADGPIGRLVENTPAAWYATLDHLMRDRNALDAMASRARETFLARGSLAAGADAARAVWMRLAGIRQDHAA